MPRSGKTLHNNNNNNNNNNNKLLKKEALTRSFNRRPSQPLGDLSSNRIPIPN